MIIGIMQPYFLPYIGYWQLLNCVDEFVIYDNIKYEKNGWINRNRYLQNGKAKYFTLPLKKDSDFLDVYQREISEEFNKKKMLDKILFEYRKAPYFEETKEILNVIFLYESNNLFEYVFNSVQSMKNYLRIETPLTVSSTIQMNHELKGQEKVIEINRRLRSNIYINAIGGMELYQRERFLNNNIDLRFIRSDNIEYSQFDNLFVEKLSIIDVLMFNGVPRTRELLDCFTLI